MSCYGKRNYDKTDESTTCTLQSGVDYIQTRLIGQGTPELALIKRKKD